MAELFLESINEVFKIPPHMDVLAHKHFIKSYFDFFRVREAQQSSLKRFQGFQAVVTLAQLLGTLFLLYSPYFAIMVSFFQD